MPEPKLEMYDVTSVCLLTRRVTVGRRLAVSIKDAIRLEDREFGAPLYRVLRAVKAR